MSGLAKMMNDGRNAVAAKHWARAPRPPVGVILLVIWLVPTASLADTLPVVGNSCADTEQTSKHQVRRPVLHRYAFAEPHMGTRFRIVLYASGPELANTAAKAAFARIAALNAICSDYDASSELSRFCAAAPHPKPVTVSHELMQVLELSQRVAQESAGAFDVTIGPLTRLWRRARRRRQLPDPARGALEFSAVGYPNLELDSDARAARLKRPGMRIDLGGIAKGFALDEALEVLRGHGIANGLVDGGGDLAVCGSPPEQTGWRIGLAPAARQAYGDRDLILTDGAVATSGDTEQFLEFAGRRYSHILDPRTGRPVEHRYLVTVVAPSGAEADAWASALSVLSWEAGKRLVTRMPRIAALMVELNGQHRSYTLLDKADSLRSTTGAEASGVSKCNSR